MGFALGAASWEGLTIETIGVGQNADGRPSIAYIDKDVRANRVLKLVRPAPSDSGDNCRPALSLPVG